MLFVSIVFFFSCDLGAQSIASKDSIMVNRIHQLSIQYSLSPSQEAAFLSLERQQAISLDSVGKMHLSPEQRKEWLTNSFAAHDRRLKDIFTPEQWHRYNKMLQDRKEAFVRQAAARKIQVQEIPRSN
jgi:protoporphyrinogen oxidase